MRAAVSGAPPCRELTLTPRFGFTCPQLGMAAGACGGHSPTGPRSCEETHMNGKQRVLAGLVAIVAMSVWTSAQQPQGNDEPAIKSEVNAFMDQYWELFSAGRNDQVV